MNSDLSSARFSITVQVAEGNLYETICEKGHRGSVVLQQQKFEVLFEIGANALEDGYFREAVSSFAASLERFYEFFIRASFYQRGVTSSEFDKAWAVLKHQSERQLGAYVMTYTAAVGEPPPMLSNARTAFRNDVVHKGRIPSREEAISYGQAVLDVLRPALLEASSKLPDGVAQTVMDHLRDAYASIEEGQGNATMCAATIVSLSAGKDDHHQPSLETALAGIRTLRTAMRQAGFTAQ
jgi:hypothetical protein